MKLNEILRNALEKPMPTAEELIVLANRRKISTRYLGVFIAVAMVTLLGLSVSAAILFGGFGYAFDVAIDTGEIEILSKSTENAEFDIDITEVWFDAHNIHLGGIVTTPEPLDPAGRYELLVHYSVNGGKEISTSAKIYPSGECESAFVLSSWPMENENGWESVGIAGNMAEITLCFERICDWSQHLGTNHIDYYTTYFGEVLLVLDAKSVMKSPLRGTNNGIHATLNEFTLELIGDLGTYHTVFVKMNDGTQIGYMPEDVKWSSHSQDSLLITFSKPMDLANVESVLIIDEWYTYPVGNGVEEVIKSRPAILLE